MKLGEMGLKKGILLTPLLFFFFQLSASAELTSPGVPGLQINLGGSGTEGSSTAIMLIMLLTVLSVAPGILLLMTSFMRIAIVLSFVRMALGTQQMPPTQVIMGLSLILTFYIMGPTFQEVNTQALQPYLSGEIDQTEAFEQASAPMKEFMAKQTHEKDLKLFLDYSNTTGIETIQDIPLTALVPAFAISELKKAFQMGFIIFVPFIMIDMIVASILMAMGMMMLPPSLISLPFKILLFILADGWHLVVESLFVSFN
jgi:flagellar biosynthesis protein FliP